MKKHSLVLIVGLLVLISGCKSPTDLEGDIKETKEPLPPVPLSEESVKGNGTNDVPEFDKSWKVKSHTLVKASIDTSDGNMLVSYHGTMYTNSKNDVSLGMQDNLTYGVLKEIRFYINDLPVTRGFTYTRDDLIERNIGIDFVIKRVRKKSSGWGLDTITRIVPLKDVDVSNSSFTLKMTPNYPLPVTSEPRGVLVKSIFSLSIADGSGSVEISGNLDVLLKKPK